jgi:formate hydrogenlyase subunit 3/multisubunit Na+/H+ antiporter MnhD subunit
MSSGWSLALIGLGLGIKLGLPGLHIWLPLAHPAAPIPASALLSGIMIKAGLFGWVFLLPIASVPNEQWVSLLAWVGVIMMLYGVILGLMQTDPKTILAYSSMSQMGWGVWAFSLVWQAEGSHATLLLLVWFMVHHGLVKTGLFLGVGWIKYSAEKVFIRPWVWSGLILLALMLAGLPWTAGAWVKLELKDLADSEMLAVPGLTLASIGTGLLMIHFLRKLVYLPIKPKVLSDSARRQANWALGSWFGLIVLALVWPYGLVESLVMDWRAAIQPIGLALVFALAWRIRIHRQYQLPAGDLLWVYRWIGLRLWSFIQLVGLGLQKSELRWRLVRHRMLRGIRRAGRMVMKSEQVFLRFGVMVMGLVWIALVLSLLAWLEQLANSG